MSAASMARIARWLRNDPRAALSVGYLAALALLAVSAPVAAPFSPIAQDVANALQPPDAEHLLGTDDLGRDVLSRLIYGAPITLYASLLAVTVASVIGVLALLLALVLGLLIWTSYGVFASQQTEAQTLSVTTLQLDYLLEQYGPESAPGRMGLRAAVQRSRDRYFGGARPDTELSFAAAREKLHDIDSFFAALHPTEEDRKQLLASAKPMAT